MHAPAVLQKIAIGCLVFELSKLRFRAHDFLSAVQNGLIKCILYETGCGGATPEGMSCHIL